MAWSVDAAIETTNTKTTVATRLLVARFRRRPGSARTCCSMPVDLLRLATVSVRQLSRLMSHRVKRLYVTSFLFGLIAVGGFSKLSGISADNSGALQHITKYGGVLSSDSRLEHVITCDHRIHPCNRCFRDATTTSNKHTSVMIKRFAYQLNESSIQCMV